MPSNLPQLLLFAAHLEQLRHRRAPRHFHALWGQCQANLTEVLGLRTNAGISRARQRIADAARRRFALSDVAAVHATVESGTAAGKVVIDVS
ncbi:hypothetical protein [Streptomyces nigra]|uniref:hypothetical protein n=1 Tax=Streptomyces nigra TaxID=1827580 RepID=UPI00369F3DB4